jgi:hypothetical protein
MSKRYKLVKSLMLISDIYRTVNNIFSSKPKSPLVIGLKYFFLFFVSDFALHVNAGTCYVSNQLWCSLLISGSNKIICLKDIFYEMPLYISCEMTGMFLRTMDEIYFGVFRICIY